MPEFNSHPEAFGAERALLVAAEFADKIHVREVGANRGYWVERFLASVGLGPSYAWCAAFVTFCLKTAGAKNLPKHPASVLGWMQWAEANNAFLTKPVRGCAFAFMHTKTTGHIGFVVRETLGPSVATIEGNTNAQGSREGDGVYRRTRAESGLKFIDLRKCF